MSNRSLNQNRQRRPARRHRAGSYGSLEPRRVLASATLVDGALKIVGGAENDVVELIEMSGQEQLSVDLGNDDAQQFPKSEIVSIEFSGLNGDDQFRFIGDSARVSFPLLEQVRFFGGVGNDRFYFSGAGFGAEVSVLGIGGPGDDFMEANADDLGGITVGVRFYGNAGDDTLIGGRGDDLLVGGDDDDGLYGNHGNDVARGNDGGDFLDGGIGEDNLFGGAGDDALFGDLGFLDRDFFVSSADRLFGGSGNDSLTGDHGDDLLVGGQGDDRFDAFDGGDTIYGGDGDDNIRAGAGDDRVFAQSGLDTVFGGLGDDDLIGGAGDDRLRGFDGNDRLIGGNGNDRLYGDDGNDVLSGNAGNDLIFGSSGNDRLFGGPGNDELNGGTDDDLLNGFEGFDTLRGQAGSDIFVNALEDRVVDFSDTEDVRDPNVSLQDFIGLTLTAGGNLADALNRDWRISSRDGDSLAQTTDYIPSRLSFTIVNDLITGVRTDTGQAAP